MITDFINLNTIYTLLANGTYLPFLDLLIMLLSSVFLGFYVFFIYKYCNKQSFYSKDFNSILPGMGVISTTLIITMHSNIFVFLGIIGALSVVRFRHALKNPLDLFFLFWTLFNGILCGARLYIIALMLSIIITTLFLSIDLLSVSGCSYILVVFCSTDRYNELNNIILKYSKNINLRKKSSKLGVYSYVFTLKTKKEDILLHYISQIPSLKSINFTSYNGEYRE